MTKAYMFNRIPCMIKSYVINRIASMTKSYMLNRIPCMIKSYVFNRIPCMTKSYVSIRILCMIKSYVFNRIPCRMFLATDRYSVAQYIMNLHEINNVFHMCNVARLPYTEEHYNMPCNQPQIK
jgi:hypothetical protein